MKLTDFGKSSAHNRTQVSMTVSWEDSDRPSRRIRIETDARFENDLNCNPNAFLLAAVMPAMRHNEKRISVQGSICPHLRNGVTTAMLIFRKWYGEQNHHPLTIECSKGFSPGAPCRESRTGSFLSGGVDALATLRANRLDFPLHHHGSIRDCFFVHGFDLGGYVDLESNQENSQTATDSLSQLADSADVTLIPVTTNIRHIDDSDNLFFQVWFGAALASVAHAFSRRISTALIAAGSGVDDLGPIGSHPLIDPHYSNAELTIRHDGVRFSRLEKVGLIAQWPEALLTLRSCFDAFRPANVLNCGTCEKCLRTMTGLLVFDKLRQCPTYPHDDVTPEMIRTLRVGLRRQNSVNDRKQLLVDSYRLLNMANSYYWRQFIEPLGGIGRDDLVEAIEEKLAQYDQTVAPEQQRYVRGLINTFDRKFLRGMLRNLYRKLHWS